MLLGSWNRLALARSQGSSDSDGRGKALGSRWEDEALAQKLRARRRAERTREGSAADLPHGHWPQHPMLRVAFLGQGPAGSREG